MGVQEGGGSRPEETRKPRIPGAVNPQERDRTVPFSKGRNRGLGNLPNLFLLSYLVSDVSFRPDLPNAQIHHPLTAEVSLAQP